MRCPFPSRRSAAVWAALGVAWLAACNSGEAPGSTRKLDAVKKAAGSARTEVHRPELVRGPSGGTAIAPYLQSELKAVRSGQRNVLVYVGASWCEPCKRFHQAVEKGELDEILRGTRIVEFDLDVDRDALQAAGYASRLIPLFAVPRDDGTASERRIEGSVKGEGAVEKDLVPRLRALLAGRASG